MLTVTVARRRWFLWYPYNEPRIASIAHSQRSVCTGTLLCGRDLQGERLCLVPGRGCNIVLSVRDSPHVVGLSIHVRFDSTCPSRVWPESPLRKSHGPCQSSSSRTWSETGRTFSLVAVSRLSSLPNGLAFIGLHPLRRPPQRHRTPAPLLPVSLASALRLSQPSCDSRPSTHFQILAISDSLVHASCLCGHQRHVLHDACVLSTYLGRRLSSPRIAWPTDRRRVTRPLESCPDCVKRYVPCLHRVGSTCK